MKLGSFEGWYFKQNTYSGDYAFALIPGRATDQNGIAHAFIQMNHTELPHSYYIKYPVNEFHMKKNPIEIQIGDNYFSPERIDININKDGLNLRGKIEFHNRIQINKSIYSPGIMGPFGYLPFLECIHEVISLNHLTSGNININGKQINFTDGNGYIESDAGTSFPKSYIWVQSNHFKNCEFPVSLMCAIAKVPVLSKSIRGFICVLSVSGKEYRFATYNFSEIKRLSKSQNNLSIILSKGNLELNLEISGENGAELAAPTKGSMEQKIKENIDAKVKVELKKNGELIFKGIGINTGYEILDLEGLQ